MSALPPIDNRNVRSVLGRTYPPNLLCAVPGCTEEAESMHHIFGRPPGEDSGSWFVEIREEMPEPVGMSIVVIPHVVGLCGTGTTGHHGDVEEHRAWIKLEEEGFVWYERRSSYHEADGKTEEDAWHLVGPLDPQPARGEKKAKRPRRKGEAARNAPTWTIRFPEEGQKGRIQDKLEQLEEKWLSAAEIEGGKTRGPAFLFELALDYTLLNAGPEDF